MANEGRGETGSRVAPNGSVIVPARRTGWLVRLVYRADGVAMSTHCLQEDGGTGIGFYLAADVPNVHPHQGRRTDPGRVSPHHLQELLTGEDLFRMMHEKG